MGEGGFEKIGQIAPFLALARPGAFRARPRLLLLVQRAAKPSAHLAVLADFDFSFHYALLMREMAKARYTVQVPKADPAGNSLRVGQAAHQFLMTGPLRLDLVNLSFGHPHDALHIHADDTPEHDSHVKQLAAFLGEVANAEAITAAKEGKGGVQTWAIRNPHYRAGEAAESSARHRGQM